MLCIDHTTLHLGITTHRPCPHHIPSLRSIVEFAEKPKGDALEKMRVDTTVLGALCMLCTRRASFPCMS